MPPKNKAKAKAKGGYAKEAAPAVVEEEKMDPETAERKRIFLQRRAALKWAQPMLETVQLQARAAEKADIHWLSEYHAFHENNMLKIVRCLDKDKTLDDVPQEARDKIAAYVAQSAKGPGTVDQEAFQPMQDIWDWTLEGGSKYERPAETAEDKAAIEKLTDWTDSSTNGIAELCKLMKNHAGAPAVQQIGLIRIGALCPEEGKGDADKDVSGMTAATLVPVICTAMKDHMRDTQVLRGGYAALRGVALVPGQLAVLCDLGGVRAAVEALKKHYKDDELASTANMTFYAMAREVPKNSPELKEMQEAGVVDALSTVMKHHAYNVGLCGKVRLTFPFLTEE